jgi:hypothetical protein
MVSIKYFCGVGEFWRVKSNPCGGFTSKTGAARGESNIRPKKIFSNLGFPSG